MRTLVSLVAVLAVSACQPEVDVPHWTTLQDWREGLPEGALAPVFASDFTDNELPGGDFACGTARHSVADETAGMVWVECTLRPGAAELHLYDRTSERVVRTEITITTTRTDQ